ncbi:MAG: hypothetical protein RLO50_09160 [Azospirillaceae bacterium]
MRATKSAQGRRLVLAAAALLAIGACQNQRATTADAGAAVQSQATTQASTQASAIQPAYPTIDPTQLDDANLIGVLDAALAGCQTATYAALRQEMSRRADTYSAQAQAGIATPETIVQRDRFQAVLGATPAGDPCPPRATQQVPVQTGGYGYVAPRVGVGIGGGSNGVGAGIGISVPIF